MVDFAKLRASLGNVTIDAMQGDNLAVTLCRSFENPDQEPDDYGWTPDANAGCDQTLDAIHHHYAEALSRLSVERDELKAEAARLRTIICASAAAIGNGSVLSPECSIDFMEILPEEIAKHTDKLRRFLKCSRDEGGEALLRAETTERQRVEAIELLARIHRQLVAQGINFGPLIADAASAIRALKPGT